MEHVYNAHTHTQTHTHTLHSHAHHMHTHTHTHTHMIQTACPWTTQKTNATLSHIQKPTWTSKATMLLEEVDVGIEDVAEAGEDAQLGGGQEEEVGCLLYTSPSPRDEESSRMPSSA